MVLFINVAMILYNVNIYIEITLYLSINVDNGLQIKCTILK
jgi:hypothetical protein